MITTLLVDAARELYDTWLYEYDPDSDIDNYYAYCEFADILTHKVLNPLRQEFLHNCRSRGLTEVQAIQLLYQRLITCENEGDTINYMAFNLMIAIIDDNHVKYDSKIRILDNMGHCVIISNT